MMKNDSISDENLILWTNNLNSLSWDIEIDILIIGAGGCGFVAALAGAEKGVEIFLVEKEKIADGNTSLSQGMDLWKKIHS